MPDNNYVIGVKAKSDIKGIAIYILKEFGERQSLKYAHGLKEILGKLANNPGLGRRYVAVKNQMLLRYRYRCKSHVIFYYIEQNGIFVVRILGGMMDFTKHLR